MKLYGQALLIYAAFDIAYQAAVGLRIFSQLVESAGLRHLYGQPSPIGMALMGVFFLLIALANMRLCVLPAIAARSVPIAARNGALFGTAAYATLGLTNAWSLPDFPLVLALVITAEGCVLSLVTSSLTTWLHLRSTPEPT